ncbi:transcription elongation factor GreA [Candidatus Parcubacteria bacterium]|nr:MAG: transcription elongation factor GreA [Candidatus Parcubacteria bacterium]
MRTPQRKLGKYSHLKPDPNITEKKYNELMTELEKLKKIFRPPAIKEVKRLALMGDFSENAAYQIAKGRLRGINKRIDDIEDHLKRANVIKTNKSDQVELGSTVTILIDNKEKTYTILGSSETDPSKNVISHNSPIGQAIMHKKKNDIIEFKISGNTKTIKILNIK